MCGRLWRHCCCCCLPPVGKEGNSSPPPCCRNCLIPFLHLTITFTMSCTFFDELIMPSIFSCSTPLDTPCTKPKHEKTLFSLQHDVKHTARHLKTRCGIVMLDGVAWGVMGRGPLPTITHNYHVYGHFHRCLMHCVHCCCLLTMKTKGCIRCLNCCW